MNQLTWSTAKKAGFRFLFIFFTLMASPWNWVPYLGDLIGDYFYYPSFLVQNYLLKMHTPPVWEHAPTGSGDTIDDWILTFTWLAVAVIGCIIWSLLDRKRTNYVTLNYWFRVTLRYYLAVVLFTYGLSKIFPLQMPFPTLGQMQTPLGDLSPMRLAWLFIGYSVPYEIFGGLLETVSGIFLSIRRTQLLGALMTLATIGNVVMINFCYDIPVKLFSSQLFLMALYVGLHDYKRLLNFFILHKTAEPRELGPAFNTRRDKIIRWVLLGLFWVFGLGYTTYQTYGTWKDTITLPRFALYGSYDVQQFSVNDSLLNSPTDTLRWNQVVMSNGFQANEGRGMVKRGTYKVDRTIFTIDSLKNFAITFRDDTTRNFTGQYEKLNDLELLLRGRSNKDSLIVHLLRIERKFKLETKPFHWVSAFPY